MTKGNFCAINIEEEECGSVFGYTADSDAENIKNYLESEGITDPDILQSIRRHQRVSVLKNLWVDEENRGSGCGNLLWEDFLWDAKHNSSDAIITLSDKWEEQEEGFTLKDWYIRKGFKELSETPSGYLMIKEL